MLNYVGKDISNRNSSRRWICPLLCIIALALAIPFAAQAQVVTANVRGTVKDAQKASIAGAEVTISNEGTRYSRTQQTSADGEYVFTDLPLGIYEVHVSHTGFKASTQTGIELHANDSLSVNIELEIGAISETITVEASPIAVETNSGELSGLIHSKQVAELPLNGRNFMQLLTLVPGVAPAEAFSVTDKGLKGASDVSISGGPSNGNQWLVDGANNNDTGSQRTILIYPSVDSIEEFKIERNSYGPEFGLAAGGQVSIITKSGTNQFHGGVFYSGRNDALDAFDTELKAGGGTKKNKLRLNDYGFNVGGPVLKNKAFFFWSEEWNKVIGASTFSARVPTAAERTGDYSALAACHASNVASGHNDIGFPIDPVTGAPALHNPAGALGNESFGATLPSANQIPTSISGPLMSMFPLPTSSDPCASQNWVKSENLPTPWREDNIRGDVNLTKTLTLMMRYAQDSWVLGPPSGGFGWGNNALGVIDESWKQPGKIAVGKLSKTIGSNIVNDFTFSFSQNQITINPTNVPLEQQLNTAIPYFFPLSGKTYGTKGPSVWFQGATNLPGVWTIAPWANEQDLFTFVDDFHMVKGRHSLIFGTSLSRNMKDEQQSNLEYGNFGGPTGYNGCSGAINAACPHSTGNTTGYNPADMLLEGMTYGMGETNNIFTGKNRWHNYEFYAGDTFHATNKLTVVYGFRWSLLPNPYLADNRYTVFNPIAFNAALGRTACNGLLYAPGLGSNPCPAGTGGMAGPNNALYNNNNHMIAPRLSFAYDPTGKGKWAIRAGIGQFFMRDRLYTLQISGQNPPFVSSFSSTNGRFLDSLTAPPACLGSANCFSTGLGFPNYGNEISNQMPNSWQFNFEVQRELWKDTVFTLGYVGNRGIHLLMHDDINSVAPADRLAYFENSGDAAARAALRPYGAVALDNGITYYTRSGQSKYDSLQSSFKTRFSRNSTFQFAYTWSKLLSDTVLIDSPYINVDSNNPRAGRGLDYLNRPHIFVANVVYYLPTLNGQNAVVRQAAGGWELSSILNFATGPSLTPTIGADLAGIGDSGQQRPMLVPGQSCQGSGSNGRQWLNPNAFTVNGLKIGQLGSSGVGMCTGPGNSDVDLSLRKNFKLTERIGMQFQFDFFNLFNHPQYQASALSNNGKVQFNYNTPQRTVGVPTSALYADKGGNPIYPTAATGPGSTGCNAVTHMFSATGADPETMCAASIINTTYNPSSNFGLATGTRSNGWRQLQYGLKFTF
ncbi:MAG: carboxypeptidase regulatory-like domain-containing protein [Candidatus Acidiferrum sp.]